MLGQSAVFQKFLSAITTSLCVLLLAGLLSWGQGGLLNQENITPEASPQPEKDGWKELGIFLDEVIAVQMKTYEIPGLAISLVKDSKLFLAKGYGFADNEKNIPVDAGKTLFSIASVAKLFTCTAVMQLVEQGKLDLHADVNMYLKDLKIPQTYPEPITLAHLMTHTAGFESGLKIDGPGAKKPLPPGDSNDKMPARVHPPGNVIGYNNYNISLAGRIAAEVSGLPLKQYLEKNILVPLEMRHSIIKSSTGLSVTATDMANFMIAHLQNGRYGDIRLLQDETAREMHTCQFRRDPEKKGIAYGFWEMDQNNQRIIGHSGVSREFQSLLVLLPEHNVGLFISNNSPHGAKAEWELLKAFLDRFYPVNDRPF